MKYWYIFIASALFTCCFAYKRLGHKKNSPERRGSPDAGKTWRMTTIANRYFAHRLFKNIARQQESGNIVISPFVVSTGLSMVLLGAEGETEAELMKLLGYDTIGKKKNGRKYTKRDVPRLYETVLGNMKRSSEHGGYMFTIASRLFAEQSETFLPNFIDDTERYFGARLEQLDFMHNAEESRTLINEWVSNKTENTIPEALPGGYITSNTLLTLVSSVYFKGEWEYKFEHERTKPGTFTMQDGTEIEVDYMDGVFQLEYKKALPCRCHILVLPYKTKAPENSDYKVSMELYLPSKRKFLPLLLNMDEDFFHRELRNVYKQKVTLKLPKFRINYDIDLVETLQRLKVVTLFNNDADLSGMNEKYNINLGTAMHKTFMEVNEEGTTAASSLSIGSPRSADDVVLHFDHTFVLIIREKSTNTILFMGRIDQPIQ